MRSDLFADPLVKAGDLLSGHPFFRMPEHLPGALSTQPDPIFAALPVIFWMMEIIRPNVVVNSAQIRGLAHLACCQAVVTQESKAVCHLLASKGASVEVETLRRSHFGDCSLELRSLDQLPEATVDLATVPVALSHDVSLQNWSDWFSRLSARGVLLVYGIGCHDLVAAGTLEHGGSVLRLGTDDAPLLVRLGTEAPSVLQKLAGLPSDASVRRGLNDLIRNQMQRLELEVLARAQSLVGPDPTALKLSPPRSLAEAEMQTSRLIEQQVADLAEMQAEFDSREAAFGERKAELQREMLAYQAELERKDAIITALEAYISSDRKAPCAQRRGIWQRLWTR